MSVFPPINPILQQSTRHRKTGYRLGGEPRNRGYLTTSIEPFKALPPPTPQPALQANSALPAEMAAEGCAPQEHQVHCQIRQLAGGNAVNLSTLRGFGATFDAWLHKTPVNHTGGCPTVPPDGTSLRVHVHAEDMEFGYELVQLAPYAYAACRHGVLVLRSICAGMRPFYYFAGSDALDAAMVVPCIRSTMGPNVTVQAQHARPTGRFWERQPPYRAAYRSASPKHGTAFVMTKQGIIGMPLWAPSGVHNAWSLPGLVRLLAELSAHANQVYYFRAGSALPATQTGDDGPSRYNDTAEIRARLPGVVLLQDMIEHEPASTYAERLNVAQLVRAASADVVVATQGGSAVLASLVAHRLVILCRVGQECRGEPREAVTRRHGQGRRSPDVTWWRRLNNATIVTSGNEVKLTATAVQMLLDS